MKIVHVITTLTRGGAENMLYKLLSATPGGDHIVISLVPGGVYADRISELGVPVHTLGMTRGMPGVGALMKLRRLIAETDPDVVHGWMYHAALMATFCAAGRPVIWGIRHSLADIKTEKPVTRAVIHLLARISGKAAAISYNSSASRGQHEALGYASSRAVVIPNGFDVSFLKRDEDIRAARRSALGLSDEQFAILHVARFHPMKDHAGMIRAMRSLLHDPRYVFLFAGTNVVAGNPMFAGLDTSRFHAAGETPDVRELMNAADMLCLSSAWGEAFPNVLGEAMACELPCVATDVGDSAAIVAEHGIVVPPGQPEALADAIVRIANMSREERQVMGRRARVRVVQAFSLEKTADAFMDLYSQCAGAKAASLVA